MVSKLKTISVDHVNRQRTNWQRKRMGGRVVSEIRNRVLRTVSETSDSFLCTSPHVSAKGVELVRNTDLPDSVRLIFPRQSYTPEFWRHPQAIGSDCAFLELCWRHCTREHGAREEGSMIPCLCNVTAELAGLLTANPSRHTQQLSKRFFFHDREQLPCLFVGVLSRCKRR